jgi:hypothetical protein
MTQLRQLKSEILGIFREQLSAETPKIAGGSGTHAGKAREMNALANVIKVTASDKVAKLPIAERPNHALILQYCFSVASLEYRHRVWPYEYMAFSRRVGELWEAFCRAAWDYPSRPGVARITAPEFGTVRDALLTRIKDNVGAHHKRDDLLRDVATLFEVIGDINMREDEVFSVDGIPHVIDFKSGFGSNEKGNMLRLQTVGKAYRIWNKDTRLLLLVRQDNNNNYLNVLRRMGLWEVHTGAEAYKQISALTGADMQAIRDNVVNWQADLSKELYLYLRSQPTDLTRYLMW